MTTLLFGFRLVALLRKLFWPEFTYGRMGDGISFVMYVPTAEFVPMWSRAMKSKTLIELRGPSGKRWMINPKQILYVEAC